MIQVIHTACFIDDKSGLEKLSFSSMIISRGDTVMTITNKLFLHYLHRSPVKIASH